MMQTLKFETNINSEKAFNKINERFKSIPGITDWNLDLEHSNKILTVKGNGLNLNEISGSLSDAGFFINPVKSFWKRSMKGFFKKDCCS